MSIGRGILLCVIAGALAGVLTPAVAAPARAEGKVESAGVEDIFIVRSLREERIAPTEFCAQQKVGFTAAMQDRYVFKAVATRPDDGKVIDANSREVGTLHACFGPLSAAADIDFYAEAVLGGISATGRGKCNIIVADHPEPGITTVRCFLQFSNLSPPYASGLLTTSSVISRATIGAVSDPPGYLQPSIATIRLWRKR